MNDASLVTLKDVAKAAGVSSMTVSLALRNHPKISADRRELIQRVAREMGYRPNPMASALVYQRKHSAPHPIRAELAWLNYWHDPRALRSYKEFDLYWRGATEAAAKSGFRLEEFTIGPALSCARLEHILCSRNIQGILIPPHGFAARARPTMRDLDWSRFAVVKFGYSVPDFPARVVTSNQTQGTLLAFSEISRQGYERVGYVCHRNPSTHSKAGFLMAQTKLPPDRRIPLLELDVHGSDCLPALESWADAHGPDAVLTEMSELPGLLKQLGHRVPCDLGLAVTSVMDGNADAGIYQNSDEVGRVAVEMLIGLIHQNQFGIPKLCRETLVDTVWQDGSTLPARTCLAINR